MVVVWCGVKGGSVGGLKCSHADGLKHAAANICRQPSTTWLREAGASKMGLRCNYCHSAHLFLVPVPRDLPSCLRINERYVRIFLFEFVENTAIGACLPVNSVLWHSDIQRTLSISMLTRFY